MDAVKFLMESNRICQSSKFCGGCPMSDCCVDDVEDINDAIKTVAAVEKWSKEHPIKTNGGRFLYDNREHIRTYHRWDNGCKPYIEVHIEAEWWDAEYKEGDE